MEERNEGGKKARNKERNLEIRVSEMLAEIINVVNINIIEYKDKIGYDPQCKHLFSSK